MPKETLFERYRIYVMLLIAFVATYALSSYFDIFDRFYEYSRAHEDWELDEIAVFGFDLLVFLALVLVIRSRRLARALIERDEAQSALFSMARHDVLTGLPNRRAVEEALGDASAASDESRAALMLDVDRFQTLNDLHGQEAGDAVLRALADRLRGVLGPDDIASRIGGDEFFVLVRTDDPRNAERLARRIMARCLKPIDLGQSMLHADIGIGMATATGAELPQLLSRAEQALRKAKAEGRNTTAWYDKELETEARDHAALEADLREAIKKGALEPWFQPVIDLGSGRMMGFEVLARWNHPDRGMVPAQTFVEVAEDAGLVSDLGWQILTKACRTALPWDSSLKMSVNVSPQQFRDPKFVPRLLAILEREGFDPLRLELEITETAVIDDMAVACAAIERLKEEGIRVALDDFGTGFSSFANLRRLPLDRLKIDRSFVSHLEDQPDHQHIVSGMVTIARGLDLEVTAEGIETEQDLAYLREIRCPAGQGYLFDKPMCGEDFAERLGNPGPEKPFLSAGQPAIRLRARS